MRRKLRVGNTDPKEQNRINTDVPEAIKKNLRKYENQQTIQTTENNEGTIILVEELSTEKRDSQTKIQNESITQNREEILRINNRNK